MFGFIGTVGKEMGFGNLLRELGGQKPTAAQTRQRLAAQQVVTAASAQNARVEVKIQDSPSTFSSGIAGIDIEEGVFFSDPLIPGSGNNRMTPKKSVVTFALNLDGAQHTFACRYLGSTTYNSFKALVFSLPEKVASIQRRLDFRVTPKIIEPVELVVKIAPLETETALDISAGGISFRTHTQFEEGVNTTTALHLPRQEGNLAINLLVVGAHPFAPRTKRKNAAQLYTIRARFDKIRAADDDRIRAYITLRQREMITGNR